MPNLLLDLRYLRCALYASQLGSFRRAAESLGLPQSSLSRRIQLLEHRLGFPLFERRRTGVMLTRAGATFLENAIPGAEHLDFAARRASVIHRGGSSEVRVGIVPLLAGERLRRVLRVFKEQHPGVSAFFTEGSLREIRDAVTIGKLDIGFVLGDLDLPACHSQALWIEPIAVVLPVKHRLAECNNVSWASLDDETFLVGRRGPGADIQELLLSRTFRQCIRPRVEIHDVSHTSLVDMVRMNYGITIASASYLVKDSAGVVSRPLEGEAEALTTSALWRQDNANPAVPHLVAVAEYLQRNETAGSAWFE
ncbi:LysR family transcriptional regulator [Rhizobium sp. CFBP 8762]|uniref:LysR family transcriptional regulator n=1 Tax=Rhizobium sp. CFBP 8762 TaxID=2775279 RepID=UPI001785B27D|nr:LysR family transcriptional regulator [Rhizobium sp. CFBP 8762]MBD8553853.1 LysR family transcriptional regulator [Rhizobium sp. CFBP 8762]